VGALSIQPQSWFSRYAGPRLAMANRYLGSTEYILYSAAESLLLVPSGLEVLRILRH
jgi:hypothetical protein